MEEPAASTAAAVGGVELDRVIALFRGPNSADLHDRHVAAMLKLASSNPQGFAIRDLPKVQSILELSIELLRHGVAAFVEPLCHLIGVLGKPFIRRTATDEFKMLSNITSLLTTLGSVFYGAQLPDQLQLATLQTITAFANAHASRPNALELVGGSGTAAAASQQQEGALDGTQRKYHTNQSLVCKSGVVADILQALAASLLPGSPTARLAPPLCSTLLNLSYYPANCSSMVAAGVLQCLACLLTVGQGCRAETTGLAVELLWNVVENAPEARAALASTSLPPLEAVAAGAASGRRAGQQRQLLTGAAMAATGRGAAACNGGGDGESVSGAFEEEGEGPIGRMQGLSDMAGALTTPAAAAAAAAAAQSGLPPSSLEPPDDEARPLGCGSSYEVGGGDGDSAGSGPSGCSVLQPLADALASLLASLLQQGFSAADKELRNDIMVVLNLLLESEPFRHAAAYSGVFQALLAVSTCPEVGSRPDLVQPYALTADPLDHELRLLAWAALVHVCLLPEQLAAAVAGGFVRVLLLYLGPAADVHPAVRRWNADQLACLRSAALSRLHQLSPLCPDEYERAGGPSVLLHFLGSPGALPGHVEGALRHLHRLVTLVPESRDALGAGGLVPLLLGIVEDTTNRPEPVRHFALMCLAAMCTLHAENQRRVRKAQGVGVLLKALSRLRCLDPLLPSPYAVAVLDALWFGVVPDRKAAARFLVGEGMGHLLAALQAGHKAHRPVILSVLSDLLENPRSHPFFHDWRSDTNKQTAGHMLIGFWNEEDALRGMTQDGVLANTARPLAGLEKRTRWLPAESVAYGNVSPAKKEMLTVMSDTVQGESLLAKTYGIFKLLGFGSLPYLEPADQAALAGIEKYCKFRQGDMWRAMGDEFEATGMRPTAPDRARLASGIELSENLAVAVREAQARLLGRAQEGAKAVEAKFFDGLRAQRKLEEEYRFLALQDRTAMTIGELRAAKEKKESMLKSSMRECVVQAEGGADQPIAAQ